MKKLIIIFWVILSNSAFAATDQLPLNYKITQINTYGNVALVRVSIYFTNTQGCSTTVKNLLQINFDSEQGREMYTALIAAAAGKRDIGFGLNGCSADGIPLAYRVDVAY